MANRASTTYTTGNDVQVINRNGRVYLYSWEKQVTLPVPDIQGLILALNNAANDLREARNGQ